MTDADEEWLVGIEERTVAAYNRRGIKAVPYKYIIERDTPGACCALGAMYGDKLPNVNNIATYEAINLRTVLDFMDGFDSGCGPGPDWTSKPEAFNAGVRTARAVTDAGLRV